MGMFDKIMLPCPNCDNLIYEQSKGGECLLKLYYYPNIPDDVLSAIVNKPQKCDRCGCKFSVETNFDIVIHTE